MYAHARCRRRGIRCESGTVPQRYVRCAFAHPRVSPRTCRQFIRLDRTGCQTSGPRGWAGGRRAECCPDPGPPLSGCPVPRRPRAERGRAPRDHRASRSGFSRRVRSGRVRGNRTRRTGNRAAADPDRPHRRSARHRPRSRRRRRTARPQRPGGRGRTARAGHRGRRGADLRGPRLLPARRPAPDPRHRRRGGRSGRRLLLRLDRRRTPRGPDRGPHRRVRRAARGRPRRAGGAFAGRRRRRPLRLLRAADPAQPLSAAPPAHPPGHRDAPALHAAGRVRARRERCTRFRSGAARPGRSGVAVRADEPARLSAVLADPVQLRHPAPADVLLLPAGLPARRARLDLRPLPPGGAALEARGRHRSRTPASAPAVR